MYASWRVYLSVCACAVREKLIRSQWCPPITVRGSQLACARKQGSSVRIPELSENCDRPWEESVGSHITISASSCRGSVGAGRLHSGTFSGAHLEVSRARVSVTEEKRICLKVSRAENNLPTIGS